MKFYDNYIRRKKPEPRDDRIDRVVRQMPAGARRVLDIGCGAGRNLQTFSAAHPDAEYYGIDIGEGVETLLAELGFAGKQCDASQEIPYPDRFFDLIVCGEVIEHVVDTDNLLAEIRRVMTPDGLLILTTPNLAYLANRLMLMIGLQPFFTETSLRCNLGRRLKALGQGNEVQGHLRIFTLPALIDLLRLSGFSITEIEGYRWIGAGLAGKIDAALTLRPSFAAGFVVAARPNAVAR
ncbi:MAG: class I SAM-dependent methyltransferase [Vulcanimicrobiaceae bacterium]